MARLVAKASSQYFEKTSAVVTGYPFTLSAWFKPTSSNATGTVVGLGRTVTASNYFAMGVTSAGKPFIESDAGGVTADAIHLTSVTNGTWGLITAVCTSATDRKIYFNGINPVQNTTSQTPASLNTTNIGALTNNTRQSFADGDIAEVGIWNVALTADEVLSLAKGMSPQLIRPSALLSYAPMIEPGTGNTPDVMSATAYTAGATPAASSSHPAIIYPPAVQLTTKTASTGNQTISPTGIASTATIGAPSVTPGAVTISPTAIASTATIGAPAVTSTYTISPAAIASTASLGAPTLTPGAVTISPSAIASTAALGSPAVGSLTTISPVGIDSTATIGAPALSSAYTISPAGIASTAALGSPTTSGLYTISPASINNSNSFGTPTFSGLVDQVIHPASIINGSGGVAGTYPLWVQDTDGNRYRRVGGTRYEKV